MGQRGSTFVADDRWFLRLGLVGRVVEDARDQPITPNMGEDRSPLTPRSQ
jgi:hypothetical protein